MKKGRKLAESYGYKVTYFVGGNIRYAAANTAAFSAPKRLLKNYAVTRWAE